MYDIKQTRPQNVAFCQLKSDKSRSGLGWFFFQDDKNGLFHLILKRDGYNLNK